MDNNTSDIDNKLLKLFDSLRGHLDYDFRGRNFLLPILLVAEKYNLDSTKEAIHYDDMSTLLKALQNSEEEYAKLSYMLLNQEDTHRIDKAKFSKYKNFVKALSPTALIDNFNEIFEYTCEITIFNFMNIPKKLAKLIATFCPTEAETKIYNPCGILDEFAVQMPRTSKYTAQTINHTYFLFNKLRALALGLKNTSYLNENMVDHWLPEEASYDFIIGNPPFGLKLSTDERKRFNTKFSRLDALVLEKCYETVKHSGKAVCLFPAGQLTLSTKYEKQLRKQIVSDDLLETVIILPENILANTRIPTAIMVLSHEKTHKGMVRFIDASNDFVKESSRQNKLNLNSIINSTKSDNKESKLIPIDEIAENDYDLNSKRYLLDKLEVSGSERIFSLRDVIEIMPSESKQRGKGRLVHVKDLSDDKINKISSFDEISSIELDKRHLRIKEDCLLISLIGNKLKQTYFKFQQNPICIYPSTLKAYSIKMSHPAVDVEYLLYELDADYIKDQIAAFSFSSVISHLRPSELLDIKIKVPSLDEQKAKVKGLKTAFIELARREAENLAEIHNIESREKQEFASLRHSLGRPLGNMRSTISILNRFMQEQGISSLFINKRETMTFEHAVLALSKDLSFVVDSLKRNKGGLNVKNYPLEPVDLKEFVYEYCERLKRSNISYEVNVIYDEAQDEELKEEMNLFVAEESDLYDTPPVNALTINANKDLLKILLDDIVTNAEKHAFNNPNRNDYELVFKITLLKSTLLFEVADNGKGFPKGFDKETFIMRNESAGDNRGQGIGGADINSIVTYFKGTFELPANSMEHSTVYSMKFPLIVL